MIRFIFICMAFIVCSFALSPVFFGLQKEHQELTQISAVKQSADEAPLSFEEIYALADEIDPAALNNIAPAAGQDTAPIADHFTTGFSNKEDSALADVAPTPALVE